MDRSVRYIYLEWEIAGFKSRLVQRKYRRNKEENIEENQEKNVEENKGENIEENKEENIEENKEENIEENKEENIEENNRVFKLAFAKSKIMWKTT